MAKKIVISVISLVLVVGAVIGVVVVVKKNGKTNNTMASNKAVESICKPTEYKDECNKLLGEVAKNSSATNSDYIIAAYEGTLNELKKALEKASSVKKSVDASKDPASFSHLENCENMLTYANEEIEQVVKFVSENDEASVVEEVDSLLVWLTAVRAYQTICVDGIENEQLKKDIQQGVDTATKMTFNAQSITYNALDILKDLGFDVSNIMAPSTGSRKLLEEVEEIEREGFPSWVSASDRKLLGKGGKGKRHRGPRGQALFRSRHPQALPPGVRPNAVVALDGSGNFKSIKAALAAYPPNYQGRYTIYVKAGVYNEGQIVVQRNQNNVYMYGDGRGRTIITGDINHAKTGFGAQDTAIFVALGERFMARGITFRNTAGPAGEQAVAFRSQSPHTVVVDCSIEGFQDSLYYQTHDQFYKNCEIHGTVDFIFGMGRAVIQDCTIIVRLGDPRRNKNTVTADGRMKTAEMGGVVIQNCRIIAARELEPLKRQVPSYLGRPWKDMSTTAVIQSDIGDFLRPEGWMEWDKTNNHITCIYREFANRGPGSFTGGRVRWPGFRVITNGNEALQFTAGRFINGQQWLPAYRIGANLGLY